MKQWAIRLMQMATGWVLVSSMLLSYSSGMVLCIGNDGHVAVEPAHEQHCDSEVRSAQADRKSSRLQARPAFGG